jgi:hypothetical protein
MTVNNTVTPYVHVVIDNHLGMEAGILPDPGFPPEIHPRPQ